MSEFIGTQRFQIQRRLGAGGFGVVYEALDNERNARVALKTLARLDPVALYRFKREFRTLADVSHENLVELHELVSVGDQWFFTMELIAGVDFLGWCWNRKPVGLNVSPFTDTLAADVGVPNQSSERPIHKTDPPASRELPPIDYERLRPALRQLAQGVLGLHGLGILHRDIKPSNILVSETGRVVLVDFGIATEMNRPDRSEVGISGTPAYMAPEQGAGLPLSEAADWYAVGCVLYEAITGAVPFSGAPMQMLMDKQLKLPKRPREVRADVPDDLDRLCMALLRTHPDERPTGAEVLERLSRAEEGGLPASGIASSRDSSTLSTPSMSMPFVGREVALQTLLDAYRRVVSGQPATVFVHGRSGMGKSALVSHFFDVVGETSSRREELYGDVVEPELRRDAVVLMGRCYERESVPYKAFDSLIDSLTQVLIAADKSDVLAWLPRDASILARVFPVLNRVPAFSGAPKLARDVVDPQQLRTRAFGALRELLTRLADRRPLIVFIDDLQWGDADSAALLAGLTAPPDPPAFLLILGYRSDGRQGTSSASSQRGDSSDTPGTPRTSLVGMERMSISGSRSGERAAQSANSGDLPVSAESARSSEMLRALEAAGVKRSDPSVSSIVVGALSHEDARLLAGILLGSNAPSQDPLADEIATEAQGSPFFIGELVRYIRSTGAAATLGGLRLVDMLRDRLRSLPEGALRLLEIAATAAGPIAIGVAFRAADLTGDQRAATLGVLRAGHLVRASGSRAADRIEPFHDRIRETTLGLIDAEGQKARHRKLALALTEAGEADPESLYLHFSAAGIDDRAAEHAEAAAIKASRALAFDRAAQYYRIALELLPPSSARVQPLRVKLADALANAGRGREAASVYLEATQEANDAEQLDLRRRAAEQLLCSGHIDEGLDVIEGVLGRVGMRLAPTLVRAIVSLLLVRIWLRIRGLRVRERDVSHIAPTVLAHIDVCWSTAVGLALADTLQAAYFSSKHLQLSLASGEPERIGRALGLELGMIGSMGGPAQRRARALREAARPILEKTGRPETMALYLCSQASTHYFCGQFPEARDSSERGLAIYQEKGVGSRWELDSGEIFLLGSMCYLGEFHDVWQRLPGTMREAQERHDQYLLTFLRIGEMHLAWLVADDAETARRQIDETMARWSNRSFQVQHWDELRARAQIDLYEGNGRAALEKIQARWRDLERSFFMRVQMIRILAWHVRARAHLAVAALEDDVAWLSAVERDAARLVRERMPWATALAELLRAAVDDRRGNKERAVARLRRALAGFESTGMKLYAAASRVRLSRLVDGDESKELLRSAENYFVEQGVRVPMKALDMVSPGFREVSTAVDAPALAAQ